MKSVDLIKQEGSLGRATKSPNVLYDRAATTEEIKAPVGAVCTSVFFSSSVLFGHLFDNIKAFGH